MTDQIFCPKCGSNQVTADQKGFSGGKALAGAVLTGGIGLLAGTIGSKDIIITCLACGDQFKPGQGGTGPVDMVSIEQQATEMLKQGKTTLDAINMVKAEAKLGYIEASTFVNKIIIKEGIQVAKPKKGCAVLIILVAAGVNGFAAVAVRLFA